LSTEPWLEQFVAEYQNDPDYIAELLAIGLNAQVVSRMEATGVRRSDLARRMGVSKAYITRLLKGNPNLTLRTVAALSLALETRPIIELQPCRTVDEFVNWRLQGREVRPLYGSQQEFDVAAASALAA
jgi:transcriptional regulator with XRE-family HTH domain